MRFVATSIQSFALKDELRLETAGELEAEESVEVWRVGELEAEDWVQI